MVNLGCEGVNYNQEEYAKKKRAWLLIDRINQYNDLARVIKAVRNHLRDSAVTSSIMGDGGMAEQHEKKGDQF